MRESLRRISGGQSTWGHHRNILWWFYEITKFHDFQLFRARIFHRSQSSKCKGAVGACFWPPEHAGTPYERSWQSGEVLFFRARIFRRIWSSISASQQISKSIFQQARSALGSELRRLVCTPRRLIPSNQPMGQLRTQWRCQENCVHASSRSKRPWIFEVFVCRIFGDFRARTRQNVVAVIWI